MTDGIRKNLVKQGGSVTVALSTFLKKEWWSCRFLRITTVKKGKNWIVLKFNFKGCDEDE